MRRGDDVQEVEDVVAVRAEEVLDRPRHRARRVVGVVHRREDKARRGVGGGGGGRDGGDDDASSEAAAEDAFAAWISAGAAAREDSSVVSGIAASDAARGWGVVSWLLRLSWRRVSRLMSTKKSSVS